MLDSRLAAIPSVIAIPGSTSPTRFRSTWVFVVLAATIAAGMSGCGSDDTPTKPSPNRRTYFMGFSSFPPHLSVASILQTIDAFAPHSDYGMILAEPPWDSLLAGRSPDSLILANQFGLAAYFRSKGLRVIVSIDPTNGLDRSSDSAPLVAAGRSLTEPAIQTLYRAYATAMDTLIHPDYISVASETNLIRALAPQALYEAVVAVANGAAADIRAHDAAVKIFTTIQVETAWGRLGGSTGPYVGISVDRADFPFIQVVGLSSYPYLGGFTDPDSIPINYYSNLVAGDPLPQMVIEGGWSSDSTARWIPWADPPILNVETQRRYIVRHAAILDHAGAIGWFQITYADLDHVSLGLPVGAAPFTSLGLVDVDLNPKPALAAWDAQHARPR
jgi:hypothetical protein